MTSVILKVAQNLSNIDEVVEKIISYLKKDKVGAIPTETFYALAGNPFSEKVLKKIFYLKKRPFDKPILLLIGNLKQLSLVVEEIPPLAEKLISLFWPGPLTIVFKAKDYLSPLLTANTKTIGVRFSSSLIVKKICEAYNLPITGTSANISEKKPLTNAKEILNAFPEIDFILDGGKVKVNTPSTVVSVIDNKLSLIREGIIPFEKIKISLSKDL